MNRNKKIPTAADARKNSNEKEEISLELAELGHLQPKQQPMTPNHREKAEKDKYY